MKILKSETSLSPNTLTKFVSKNQIAREDIFSIAPDGDNGQFVIFYFAEPTSEDEKKGFWG